MIKKKKNPQNRSKMLPENPTIANNNKGATLMTINKIFLRGM